jgi:hypothetical protein
VDESVLRNLDSQHRRLSDLENDLDRLLAGDTNVNARPAGGGPASYEQLTEANDALREQHGWDVVDLDAAITPELRAEYERWQSRQRVAWGLDDVVAVAFAGLIGIAATWFDATIDAAVRERLKRLAGTPLIRGWERDAKRMPIDYMGKGFGGPAHRVRSAGHDIGRPFEALSQIRAGQFRGFRWDHGVAELVTDNRYVPVESVGEALTLWAKHLVADVVTQKSLPLPGWTRLYELPVRDLRKFAHDAYDQGANLRSLSLSSLPVLSTEIVVRTHVHGRTMLDRRTAILEPAETALRAELLLAGHALVGAAALGKAVTLSMAVSPAASFWHINVPVLMRTAMLALQVAGDVRARRRSPVPSWDVLALAVVPWHLAAAEELDRAVFTS